MGIYKGRIENNNIGLFIKYGINEFIKNIKDMFITKLNLNRKKIIDEKLKNILENASIKQIKELKELDLSFNEISDIKVLQKVKVEKLEILDLSYNKISNINILEKVDFKELKELYLS